eukprot:scaffold578_cov167-Amphora_coffeaeformis.AAC.51
MNPPVFVRIMILMMMNDAKKIVLRHHNRMTFQRSLFWEVESHINVYSRAKNRISRLDNFRRGPRTFLP